MFFLSHQIWSVTILRLLLLDVLSVTPDLVGNDFSSDSLDFLSFTPDLVGNDSSSADEESLPTRSGVKERTTRRRCSIFHTKSGR